MAPGFLSKLVKPSGSHSRNSSAQSSPQSPASASRNPSISISSVSSAKNSEERAGVGASAASRKQLAASIDSADDGGPNVTVIPPSPSLSGSSIPIPHPSPTVRQCELAPEDAGVQ